MGFRSAGGSSLADLSDVDIAGVTAGKILRYNGVDWVDSEVAGADTYIGSTDIYQVNDWIGCGPIAGTGNCWGVGAGAPGENVAGMFFALLFPLPKRTSFDRVVMHRSSANGLGAWRFGFYADNDAGKGSGSPLGNFAYASFGVAGLESQVIALTLEAGLYWLAGLQESAWGGPGGWGMVSPASSFSIGRRGIPSAQLVDYNSLPRQLGYYRVAGIAVGAMPDPWPAGAVHDQTNRNLPMPMFRVSAIG